MRRHTTTLVLLALAVALGLFLWFDRARVTDTEKSARENLVFPAWRRDALTRIAIAHEGESLVLERDKTSDVWRMTSPRQERVDQAALERLTTTLEFASRLRKAPDDDKVLGFDAPRATGVLTMDTLSFRFVLGGVSPRPEGSSYLRLDDGPPFVVSRELTETLLASSDTYRDRTVVPYLSLELARFEVTRPGGGFALRRTDERSFVVDESGLLAGRAALDQVWSALADMRAESFTKDEDAERLVGPTPLVVRMIPKDGKPAGVLRIGGTCPGHPEDVVVLRTAPTRVSACAPKHVLDVLSAMTSERLVDKTAVSFRHDEIEEIRFEWLTPPAQGPRAYELARRASTFHEREPADRDLDADEADAFSELLARMSKDTAEAVRKSTEPLTPIAKVRIRSGAFEDVVEIGPSFDATDEGRPVRRAKMKRVRDGAELVVSVAMQRRFLPRETMLVGRALVHETRTPKGIVLRCGTAQELVDRGSGFELVAPPGYPTDRSVSELVSAVMQGKSLLWVSDSDDGTFGLTGGEPCEVTFRFDEGSALTLRLGREGEGGIYGTIVGSPRVFVGSPSLGVLLRRIYVSHAALVVDPARVESVKVMHHGAPLRDLDRGAALRTLGSLYAERVHRMGTRDVGAAALTFVVNLAEAGEPVTIRCSDVQPVDIGQVRRCATTEANAVFDVRAKLFEPLFGSSRLDAGVAPDRDAG